MTDKTYPYKPKWWFGIVCVVFFGGAASMFWSKAHESSHGLVINKVIELSPSSAQIFYWILFALSLLFVFAGILAFAMLLKGERLITISDHSIRAPKNGFTNIEVEIPFVKIESLQPQEIQRQRFLHIKHADGKFTLVQSMFPSKAVFDEVCSLIAMRVKSLQKPNKSSHSPS